MGQSDANGVLEVPNLAWQVRHAEKKKKKKQDTYRKGQQPTVNLLAPHFWCQTIWTTNYFTNSSSFCSRYPDYCDSRCRQEANSNWPERNAKKSHKANWMKIHKHRKKRPVSLRSQGLLRTTRSVVSLHQVTKCAWPVWNRWQAPGR